LHQALDGHWSLNHFPDHARQDLRATSYTKDNSTGMATTANDIAGTAFGVQPFLLAGINHRTASKESDKVYCDTVKKGIDYLRSKQISDGNFTSSGTANANGMYAHSLAAMAMCEAYRQTSDPQLKLSAQKSIDYLAGAQDPTGGSWGYAPRNPGDTSITGWVVQALDTAKRAGLNVPNKTLDAARRFLGSVEDTQKGGYRYRPGSPGSHAMAAAGSLCRLLLLQPQESNIVADPVFLKHVTHFKQSPPQAIPNMYGCHYAHQVMYQIGGNDWLFWELGDGKKPGVRDWLVNRQERDGSWPPTGPFATNGGRIMETSLCLQALQVYQRPRLNKAPGGQ
jgi:hypothetical protein